MNVIKPGGLVFDAPAHSRAIRKAFDAVAKGIKADFDRTVASWSKPPAFDIIRRENEIEVSTESEIYGYVDQGTPPHIITPRNGKVLVFSAGGAPKTRPRVIGSGRGSAGTQVVHARVVHHPGTEAREFSETIYDKWDQTIDELVQAAIDEVR